jgi:hypothetical protein
MVPPVLDQRPRAHLDRARRDDPEGEPAGRDRLEVARVGEEREDGLGRGGYPLLASERVMAEHLQGIRSSVLA